MGERGHIGAFYSLSFRFLLEKKMSDPSYLPMMDDKLFIKVLPLRSWLSCSGKLYPFKYKIVCSGNDLVNHIYSTFIWSKLLCIH